MRESLRESHNHSTGHRGDAFLKGRWYSTFLLIVLGIQLYLLSTGVVGPLWQDVRSLADRGYLERSARLSFGDQFFRYIQFLRDEVPESGRIVLPPISVDDRLGNTGIMQFFLFPRSIVNCPTVETTEECLAVFQGSETYFLSVGPFPGNDNVEGTRRYLSYSDDLGLFLPLGS